jgi:hypothetical protein
VLVWRLWVIRKIFSGSRVGWSMVGNEKVVTIKERWIDSHLRKGRVGPWGVGMVIIQVIKRACFESLVVVV